MTFHRYPDSPASPHHVLPNQTSSPLMSLEQLTSSGGLPIMFIRIAMLGSGCAPPAGPLPGVVLKAGPTGEQVEFPIPTPGGSSPGVGGFVAIHNAAGDEANVRTSDPSLFASPGPPGVYLVEVAFPPPATPAAFNNWLIGIHNTDGAAAHDYTWVVADGDADSRQPWIDITPSSLSYDALTSQTAVPPTGIPMPTVLQVANKGTGPLTIDMTVDTVGKDLGSGFKLAVLPPGPINPNACGTINITFDAPAAPPAPNGTSSATYSATTNDKTAASSAGHNHQVTLTATTRKLEVVLLLDASGSMGDLPNGQSTTNPNLSRWSQLKTAADQLLDLLAFFGGGKGRFGVARFPGPASNPTNMEIQAAAAIDGALIGNVKNALDSNSPTNSTPMGDGIAFVMGSSPGGFGYFLGANPDDATALKVDRRWMVLMTDGASNTGQKPENFLPPPAVAGTSFVDKKVQVFSIAYGNTSDVNHPLLQQIATKSGGQYREADTNDPMQLAKAFRGWVTAGLSLDPTSDPVGALTSEVTEARPQVTITPYDTKAAFILNWVSFDADRLDLQLLTPTCELITSSTEDDNISFHSNPRYKIFTIDNDYLRNADDPTRPRYGVWTLIISFGDSESEGDNELYEYEVITESRLKLALNFDRQQYFAGDAIGLTAALSLDGMPVTNAAVTLNLRAPGQSADNFLARTRVTEAELASAAQALKGQDVTALRIKSFAAMLKGAVFEGFTIPGTIPMTDTANQGAYKATVSQTQTPGPYDFAVTAIGQTQDGVHFRRESRRQVRVGVRPDPKFTLLDIKYRSVVQDNRRFLIADVRFTPQDHLGNVFLIDPAVSSSILLTASGGEFTGPLAGDLSGSYTRSLRYAPDSTPTISLQIDGEEIIKSQPAAPVGQLRYVDQVLDFKPGKEAEPGANQHADPQAALGDIVQKAAELFVSLGAYGSLTVAIQEQYILAAGADDVTIFVQPDEDLRRYLVEALPPGEHAAWVTLGESSGVTQSFGLGQANLRAARAIRITDKSGRTRDDELKAIHTPGVSIRGVGVKQVGPLPPPDVPPVELSGCLAKIIAVLRALLRLLRSTRR